MVNSWTVDLNRIGKTIREVARENIVLSEEDLDKLLDARDMTEIRES